MFLITKTLTLDTSQYAAGDVLADLVELPLGSRDGRFVRLESVHVLDEDDQGAAFDIVFLNQSVTIANKNAAWDTTDARMRNSQGIVRIASGDYVDVGANRVATIKNIGLIMQPLTTSLWVGTVSQGTGTYSAAGIQISFGFILGH